MAERGRITNRYRRLSYPSVALLLMLGFFHPSSTHPAEGDAFDACLRVAADAIDPVSCRRMAEQGDARARNLLGVLHVYGVMVEPDRRHARDWFRRALQGAQRPQQRIALEWLRRLRDTDSVPYLIESLKLEDRVIRHEVIDTLGVLGDERVVEPLIERLADEDVWVRAAAAEALGRLGDARAVEPLLARLDDEQERVRAAVAEALGELGDTRAVDSLLDAFLNTPIHDSLLHIAAPDTFDKLIERLPELRDPGYYSASAALASLLIHFDTLDNERTLAVFLDYLHAGDIGSWGMQDTTIGTWLIELDDPRAVEALIDRLDAELEAEQEDFHVYAIVRALWHGALQGTVDRRAVQPLLALLERYTHDSFLSVDTMEYAVWALGVLADEAVVEPLIALLDGESAFLTLQLLAELGDERAVVPLTELIARLEQRDDPWMIESARRALEAIGRRIESPVPVEPRAPGVDATEHRAGAPQRAVDTEQPKAQLIERLLAGDRGAIEVLGRRVGLSMTEIRLQQLFGEPLPRYRSDRAMYPIERLGALDTPDVARLLALLPRPGHRYLLPLLATASGYHGALPALVHHATATAAYGRRLDVLGDLWGWAGERATVSAETLASDLARLSDPARPGGAAPETVERNPYLALFVARLHQQNGRHEMALEWAERGMRHAPPEHVAVHILLGWLRAEALWRLGNPAAALAVVESLRADRVPRARVLEQRRSGIALAAHTDLLESRLLEALGRHEAAFEARQRAEVESRRAKRRDGIGIEPTERSPTGGVGESLRDRHHATRIAPTLSGS